MGGGVRDRDGGGVETAISSALCQKLFNFVSKSFRNTKQPREYPEFNKTCALRENRRKTVQSIKCNT